jgi:hypothetical protein
MAIVAARSVSSFFHEVVEDALRTQRVEATEAATRYLVALLTDYAHPDVRADATLGRPLTLLLDEAVHVADPAERFERLRVLGDGVLYGCGFFGDHFEARGVDPRYLRGLGTRAYGAAGSILRRGADQPSAPDLFAELAMNFDAFVGVFSDIADVSVAMGIETSRGLVKAYERWLKTGSDRLATALTSHGMMPTRGTRGVLQ